MTKPQKAEPGMVVCAYNPSTQEAGGAPVQGQPEIDSEALKKESP
jgi:hypothetical protein